MTARLPDPRPPAPRASDEVVEFLASHTSSCPECGLILNGCTRSECPGCGWVLELAALRGREPTAENLVRHWAFRCPGCSYNLKGSAGDVCPECGCALHVRTLVPPEDARRPVRGQKTMAMIVGFVVSTVLLMALLLLAESWPSKRLFEPWMPCMYFAAVFPAATYAAWWLLRRRR